MIFAVFLVDQSKSQVQIRFKGRENRLRMLEREVTNLWPSLIHAVAYLHSRIQYEYSSEGREILRENSIEHQSKLTPETDITALITRPEVKQIIYMMVKKRTASYTERTKQCISRLYSIC